MLKKIKILIIAVSLLIVNVFGNAFAGISVFTSLNFGNGTISSINMVKQYNQISVIPSKFADMCVMLQKELTSLGFSGKTETSISKQVYDTVDNFILFLSYRINNIVKYCIFYGVKISNNISVNNIWLLKFLIMLSFITGYLGLLTAKNKINNIIMHIDSIKLCPVL